MKYIFALALASLLTTFAAAEGPHWSYDGITGPQYWHLLSKDYQTCSTGLEQSPINLEDEHVAQSRPPAYGFRDVTSVPFIHNGHAIQADFSKTKSQLAYKGTTYKVKQFHVHTPSEHRFDGKHYDMELHIVTQSADKRLLVNGILFQVGPRGHPFLDTWLGNIPTGQKKRVLPRVDLNQLVSAVKGFKHHYTYAGSLTTPPCSEGVTWIVSRTVLPISYKQLNAVRDAIGYNARPIQPTAAEKAAGHENDSRHLSMDVDEDVDAVDAASDDSE